MSGLDLHEVLSGRLHLADVIALKVRRAAETGVAYVPVRDLNVPARKCPLPRPRNAKPGRLTRYPRDKRRFASPGPWGTWRLPPNLDPVDILTGTHSSARDHGNGIPAPDCGIPPE